MCFHFCAFSSPTIFLHIIFSPFFFFSPIFSLLRFRCPFQNFHSGADLRFLLPHHSQWNGEVTFTDFMSMQGDFLTCRRPTWHWAFIIRTTHCQVLMSLSGLRPKLTTGNMRCVTNSFPSQTYKRLFLNAWAPIYSFPYHLPSRFGVMTTFRQMLRSSTMNHIFLSSSCWHVLWTSKNNKYIINLMNYKNLRLLLLSKPWSLLNRIVLFNWSRFQCHQDKEFVHPSSCDANLFTLQYI